MNNLPVSLILDITNLSFHRSNDHRSSLKSRRRGKSKAGAGAHGRRKAWFSYVGKIPSLRPGGGGGVLPCKGLMGTGGQPGYVFREFCLKQGRKISDFCLKQGQVMRGRAAPPHPRIYRVFPPPGGLRQQLTGLRLENPIRSRIIGLLWRGDYGCKFLHNVFFPAHFDVSGCAVKLPYPETLSRRGSGYESRRALGRELCQRF